METKQTRRPRSVAKVTIYEKVYNVQRKLKTVIKGGENTHNKYMYAREGDFIGEIKPLLAEQRLALLTTTLEQATDKNYEGVSQHRVKVQFTLVNVDTPTEKIESVFCGVGDDKKGSVVGLPIAYTMALKYYLAKMFIAETGTDAEAQEPEAEKGKKAGKPAQPKDAETPEQKTEAILRMVASSRNATGMREYLENMLPKVAQLTKDQKEKIRAAATARIQELESDGEKVIK